MKHTPGPWRCDERVGCVAVYPGEKRNCLSGRSEYAVHHAQGHHVNDENGQFLYWEVPEEKLANARLIAAAPDLYEILKELVPPEGLNGWWCPACKREIDGHEVTYQEYHEKCGTFLGNCQSGDWAAKARKAIAKAEGRKPSE